MDNKFLKDFPIFQGNDIVYFDNAATTQRPKQVTEAIIDFYEKSNANPMRGLYDWSIKATEAYEEAREVVCEFINAQESAEIVFTRNATESLNLVAYSYGLSNVKEGDEIVISIMEHHSNMLPWQMVCEKNGAKLVYLEPDAEGIITDEEIAAKIGPRTKIVSVGHTSNVLGITNPIKKLAAAAHKVGAVLVADGAQSTPHQKVDVKDLDVDFYAFSGHKLLGPMGIGVLYGKKKLLEEMQPFLYGGEMIEKVTRFDAIYAEVPHKFEAGTVNAAGAVGLKAAIEYVKKVGFDFIAEREESIVKRIMEGMKEIPYVTVYGNSDYKKHSGIITFNIEGCHPHDVADIMNEEHIDIRAGHHCAQPLMEFLGVSNTARASVYFYNTLEEADRFLAAVAKVRGFMGYKD